MLKSPVDARTFALFLLLMISGATVTAAQDAVTGRAPQGETEKTKSSTYEGENILITSKIKVGSDNPDGNISLIYSTSLDPLKNLILRSVTDLQSYNECGNRAYINSASLLVADNTPHVLGNLEIENWACLATDVPEFRGFDFHMTKKYVGKTLLSRTVLNVDIGYQWNMDPQSQRLQFHPIVIYRDPVTGQVVTPAGLSAGIASSLSQKTMTTAATLEDAVNVKLPDGIRHQEILPSDVKFTALSDGGISAQYTGKVSGTQETISNWLK